MAKNGKSFSVFGLSTFGSRMAVALFDAGTTVLAFDKEEELVRRVSSHVTKAVRCNVTDWDVLENLGAFDVNIAVIGLRTSFDVAVLLINHIRKHTQVETIVVQANTEEKAEALKIMGADVVVFPERDTADRVVRQLTTPNLVDHIPLSKNAEIIEIPVPTDWVGKSLIDLNIRSRFRVHVVAVRHAQADSDGTVVKIAPGPNDVFRTDDAMFLLGRVDDLKQFSSEFDG